MRRIPLSLAIAPAGRDSGPFILLLISAVLVSFNSTSASMFPHYLSISQARAAEAPRSI